ncbi:MAG: phage adaptor protein [Alphaproteobacteria bacterium]
MSISNYTDLKNAIANWLARSDLDGIIPTLIRFGEQRIYRELRLSAMEVPLTATITEGMLSVPTDYLEIKHIYIEGTPVQPLERKTARWIYENFPNRAAEGKPRCIAREAENFIFGCFPDADYALKGIYYGKLEPLSAINEVNWFVTDAPDLLLFAALSEAESYLMNDERIMLWENKYQQVKARLALQNEQEERGGSIPCVSLG